MMTLEQVIANKMTLAEVDYAWQRGEIARPVVEQYLDLWNATPGRFTRAYISGATGTIRQADKE